MSTKRIRRIDPMQSGKVTAIVSIALMLIIFVPILLLFSLIGMGSSSSLGGLILGGGLFMVILMPLIYGFFGFILGILYAVVYNFTYRYHGGLQLEYDDMDSDVDRIGT
jgi:hypothetical protein